MPHPRCFRSRQHRQNGPNRRRLFVGGLVKHPWLRPACLNGSESAIAVKDAHFPKCGVCDCTWEVSSPAFGVPSAAIALASTSLQFKYVYCQHIRCSEPA
jgi:hypothetical protein